MRGVADDDGAAAVVVRRAFDADEGEMRVLGELRNEVGGRDEAGREARKVFVEEGREGGGGIGGKRGEGGRGREQRASEGVVQ